MQKIEELKNLKATFEKEEQEIFGVLQTKLKSIGNLVHDSVKIDNNEDNNPVVRTWGKIPEIQVNSTKGRAHHHEVLAMIDGYDPKRGQKIAGHRGYFLKGMGAMLNMALVNYGMQFLNKKGYTVIQTPFFMKKSIMAETCQLSDFDDQLYKVSTGKDANAEDPDNEFYLIATSEQPISAYFHKEVIEGSELPIKFGGFSTCFRKEAGAHGKDTWGIFRIHQFEKVEQFVITTPEDSWNELERMISVSEEFYQSLELPYRVINIVSGALNDAAAKKYDLEAWFPGYNTYRELVSCSNCTDFQSRGLDIKIGGKKTDKDSKGPEYAHMLNGTLCATERTLCCILENYQTSEGVIVPKVLQPFVGTDFIPYTKDLPKKEI
jgi:seryl-tRNA synthetase